MTNQYHLNACNLLYYFLEKYISVDRRPEAFRHLNAFVEELKKGVIEEFVHPLTGLHRQQIAALEKRKLEEWAKQPVHFSGVQEEDFPSDAPAIPATSVFIA